jgi:pimeloyl-ACP methyl ester carboxylesterase
VLRYDQRGFGFSEKVRELTLEMVVADLAGLLDALKISGPVCMAGCAMGSDFAVAFCARHPERVSKLVIASPNIGATRSATRSLERAALVEREGVRAALQSSHDLSYPEHLRARDRERFRRFQSRWVCNTPASFTALAKMMATTDLTSDYPKIKARTLVIGAQHDVQRPLATAQQVAKALPGSTYMEADTGHFMNVKTPELFAQTLGKFFKG